VSTQRNKQHIMHYSLSVSLFFIICGHSAIMVSLKAVTNTSTQWDTS